MLKTTVICMALGLGISIASADEPLDLSKVDASKLPPPASKSGITYEKDIKPIMDRSCGKCHGAERPKGKYQVGTREAMLKGGGSKQAAVVPGQPAKSPALFYVADLVKDMEMPPKDMREKFPALTKEQVGIVRAWIEQGAK